MYAVLICEGMAWNMFLCVCMCATVWVCMLIFMYHTQYVPMLVYVPGGYFVVVYASAPCMCMFVCVSGYS